MNNKQNRKTDLWLDELIDDYETFLRVHRKWIIILLILLLAGCGVVWLAND